MSKDAKTKLATKPQRISKDAEYHEAPNCIYISHRVHDEANTCIHVGVIKIYHKKLIETLRRAGKI